LKELSKYATLLSGFVKEDLEKETDCLHPSFNVHGTNSGRLSSSNPNFQNQPTRVRYMFVSRFPGGRLIDADFSGIENRITAYLAKDHKRAEWLRDPGFSEHKYLCSRFTGIPYESVEKSHDKDSPYAMAKIIVHGCLPGVTEVLTPTGWISIDKWTGQSIAQWSSDGSIKFVEPLAYHTLDSPGSLFHFKGRYADCVVTPEHRMIRYERQAGKFYDVLAKNYKAITSWTTPINGIYSGNDDKDYRLAVAIQADATLYRDYAVFHLVKPRKIARLKELLGDLPYHETPCTCHKGGVRIRISSKIVRSINSILTDKKFNSSILQLTHIRALELFDELFKWDGCKLKNCQTYQSVEESNIDVLQALAHLHGLIALKSVSTKREGSFGKRPIYTLSISHWGSVGSFQEKQEIPFTGKVYCFTVPSSYFLIRMNGRVSITGNSDRCMGARKISEQFDLDFNTIKKLQAAWKTEIADTITWQKRVMGEAVRTGRVENPFGRKMWLWTAGSGPEAVSFYPQSTAADIIFRAMISLMYKKIDWPEDWALKVVSVLCPLPEPVLLITQVHDELLLDSPPEYVEETLNAVSTAMGQPWKELGDMKLPISIGDFASWGDAE
jgi:hypothetical protein